MKTVGGYDICHTDCKGGKERGYPHPEMLYVYSGG